MSLLVQDTINGLSKREEKPRLLVNVHPSSFELVVYKDKRILLTNCFDISTREDFIYYLLFTMEQLSLDPDSIPVDLVGEISKESPLYEIAYTYIRHISIKNKALPQLIETDYTATTLV